MEARRRQFVTAGMRLAEITAEAIENAYSPICNQRGCAPETG